MAEAPPPAPQVPRGRHAPPLEVRLEVQRQRLFEAGAAVFARLGYAEASAEAISREAGMSKATFYEHFANKEECILALFDRSSEVTLAAIVGAARAAGKDFQGRHRAGLHAALEVIAEHPAMAQTAVVEIIGAGPRAVERRDAALNGFAEVMYQETARAARRTGAPAFASTDEAFAIVGAIFELVSRQLRTGRPERLMDLEPLIERLIIGLLSQSPR